MTVISKMSEYYFSIIPISKNYNQIFIYSFLLFIEKSLNLPVPPASVRL